jgi:hypothetical protein
MIKASFFLTSHLLNKPYTIHTVHVIMERKSAILTEDLILIAMNGHRTGHKSEEEGYAFFSDFFSFHKLVNIIFH